ncbi:hypothetical protein ACFLZX_03405 [Nanoarchaeota archaeon]
MKKRGQITFFIIVGILMLFSVVLFLHFKSRIVEVIEPEPVAITPVDTFVTGCVSSLATEAINNIGEQGGYVEIPESIRANHNSYLSLFGFGDFIVPYWWYKGNSVIPTLESMELGITSYVKDNLKVCLGSFAPLRTQFKIEELGDIEVVTSINEDDVSVNLKYPLKVITLDNGSSQETELFNAIIPIRLKQVYLLARDIIDDENENTFLERKTIDLMAMDQSIPDTNIEVTCERREWYLPEITERMKDLVSRNFQYIKIANAEYNPNTYVESQSALTWKDSYFGLHYLWNVSDTKYRKIHATVSYLENWPFYAYARPSRNGVLRSNSQDGFGILSGLCLHIWHFTYDFVYPVMITLYDEESSTNREFRFQFATEVSVRSNTPYRENFASEVLEGSDGVYEEDYCTALRNEITITTFDTAQNDEVTGVNLTLICGGFSCPIGTSEIIGAGTAGIRGRMPFCYSGFVKGEKEGYMESQAPLQTSLEHRAYNLDLTPIKEFDNVKIRKVVDGQESDFEGRAFINVIGPNEFEENYALPVYVNKFRLLGRSTFTYNITIYVFDEESVIGGYQAEWTPSWDAMKDKNTVKFYVPVTDETEDKERYKFISKIGEHSGNVPVPVFE